ncbi:hypothetical protein [Streptomyces vilmorinianum]|uniref:hypothetical protein n=1 Tax=Streptomyces vilmorinianum TaxID=3051092 RepID=UPI0010FB9B1D|nr:hypothetical protein [Streptomyces vilmorinianum]
MSRPRKRIRTNHQATAGRAKAARGTWVVAGTYGSWYAADSMARIVRTGSGKRMAAYLPVGAFDARLEQVEDGTALWVRYRAEPTAAPAPAGGAR